MNRGAVFSDCRNWRYALFRTWDHERPPLVVIGLNPSTADETTDDPTIRRCIGYARAWGMGGLTMLNLFAFRATDPHVMLAASIGDGLDIVGPDNTKNLTLLTENVPLVLCAWGAHGVIDGRGALVRDHLRELGRPLHHLGLTKGGHPKHPLYLKADLQPVRWT